ncbi:MAG: hypothetical protein CL610_23530 [Anaerolineaceae bacterium]|nr:hypothetical protein [Anaerolineaceae bacterium]
MADFVADKPDIDPQDLVRALLEETHQFEPPTNAERIAFYLGLRVRGFTHRDYDFDLRIRAFLWPSRNLIGVDRRLSSTRRTYSILHEIGHYVLPGHATNISDDEKIVDEDRTLSVASVIKQEIEANQFAADCLFQLERFENYVADKTINRKNIQTVADDFGASFEATVRRWVETSPKPYALAVFNPASRKLDAPLTIMYTITSKRFRQMYFTKLIPGQELTRESIAYEMFNQIGIHEEREEEFEIQVGNQTLKFPMRLFTNSYRVFGLIASPE